MTISSYYDSGIIATSYLIICPYEGKFNNNLIRYEDARIKI